MRSSPRPTPSSRRPAISTYPVAKEDVALVVASDVPASATSRPRCVEGAGPLLESVRLFDVYTGEQVGEGSKSLAFALRFRAPDRTLTVDEVGAARDAAVAAAAAGARGGPALVKALVTGVTRGIGRSLVEHLVADGWDVAAVARDEAALGALAAAWDGRVTPYAADVTDGPRLAEVAAQVGDLDLVVANAGALLGAGAVWESDPDSWWRGVEVNLRGVYLTLHAVLPRMIARGSGRIVVLASGIGTGPSPYDSGYGASKAAVLHLASTVEAELAGSGVHVFPVSPGMVRTDMTRFPDELTRHLPEMADIPDDRFTPVELVLRLVDEIGTGRLDALAGRFVHARDDRDRLLAEVDPADPRPRTLRLAPAWLGDPRG